MTSLSERAWRVLEGVSGRVPFLEFGGVRVLDFGVETPLEESSVWELGLSVAEASLGGLGEVHRKGGELEVKIPENPAVACLCSQMSGWAIMVSGVTALGSGPARALARKPKDVYRRLNYSEESDKTVLCLESEALPGEKVCRSIVEKTGAKEIIVAVYKPDSVVGLVNVLARVVEMGVYRLDFLGYDTLNIRRALGVVPIPGFSKDVMFSANDAVIYGGLVEFAVGGWSEDLTSQCVSSHSRVHGKSFKDIYSEAGGDFYNIDHAVFAPAEIRVLDEESGGTYTAGERSWPK